MSSFYYLNLEKNEKEIFLPKIFDILKLFCRSKDELCVLIDDLQKNVKKLDDFVVNDEKSEGQVESMKKKKKVVEVKKKEWRFIDLSPNVVVYKILSFRLIENDEIENKFELYGYFKLDRLRNIWFIFTSVHVYGDITVPFYINIERLMYFCCNDTFFRENESFNFKNLESIYYFTRNKSKKIESIQKNNKFYKLKSIHTIDFTSVEKMNVINLQGIENLRIWHDNWLFLYSNNLRLLELNYVDLQGYEKWSQLINVEKLKMDGCKIEGDNLNSFFKVHKFEKLMEFNFYHGFNNTNVDNSLENIKVRWNYLQKIQISSSTIITDNFFINNEFKSLKTIKLHRLDLITGNKWKLSSVLQSFYVEECDIFEPSFFKRNEMKNVEKITCINCQKIDNDTDIFKKKIEDWNYKEEEEKYLNLKKEIKNKIKDIVYKKKDDLDELFNLKHLVFNEETYYKQ